MLRWLYIQLIWLHPAPFRWRFGDDMLDDFDRTPLREKPRYFADAALSLARQWVLRPEFRRPEEYAAPAEAQLRAAGVPLFQTIETYKPRPAALMHGGLLTIVAFVAAAVVISKGGGVARPFSIGVHFSRPGLLHIDRNSITGSDLNTTVRVPPDPFDAWLKVAQPYFAAMPVLHALDTDGNFTLSPWEIRNAAAALRKLDTNHAYQLTAEDCGLYFDPAAMPLTKQVQLRLRFMGYHPVLAALDSDHDGELSTSEMDYATASLMKLDRNHDGYLTPEEVLPADLALRAGLGRARRK
jgi:hypothetical protein